MAKIINLSYYLSHFIKIKIKFFGVDLFLGPLTWNCPYTDMLTLRMNGPSGRFSEGQFIFTIICFIALPYDFKYTKEVELRQDCIKTWQHLCCFTVLSGEALSMISAMVRRNNFTRPQLCHSAVRMEKVISQLIR